MKKRDLDWSVAGLFMSEVLSLLTIIREVFERLKVGIEMIPWLCNEGRDYFVQKVLEPLAQEFLKTQRVHVINATTIMVNLGVSPKLPFEGATVETHHGEGWVEVQKQADGLYVGDRKVILYLSEGQLGDRSMKGYGIRDEVTGKDILNANLLDALIKHPHLIPDDWKKDEKGNTLYLFFWATIYRDSDGYLYVRSLCWDGRLWRWGYYWLDRVFISDSPALVRAS